jgi:hypothetical protein
VAAHRWFAQPRLDLVRRQGTRDGVSLSTIAPEYKQVAQHGGRRIAQDALVRGTRIHGGPVALRNADEIGSVL